MESKARLLSRIRPGKASPKKIRGFMALPGEVRNQIYNYYFQEAFRCEIAAKESHIDQLAEKPPSETIKLCVGVTRGKSSAPIYLDESNYTTAQQRKLRVSRHWGNSKHVQGLSTKWETSLCPLILVCKQIHRETIVFLYQNTTFVFDSPKRITSFFKWVPSRNLVNVTKLQLYYVPQLGDPGQLFEGKHQVAWSRACKGFTKKMGNLQDLTVIIYTAQHVRWFGISHIYPSQSASLILFYH
ncbi:hypothetical protein CC80DRAFT_496624 [Byssothecium circinans]|uniref:DUF7730 domain-containing protein n=1 Tax=Byssothecium circinans TaxID=147558 RepID=A0A6A5TEE8_9PLEO|nr:hypothetical protein CC80DRAFT_496624 [Byssothecium circinans]